MTIEREPKYPVWNGSDETRTDALLAKNKRGMVRRHLFRYRFVSDKDGSVLRFHSKEDARHFFQLTKWHLDHSVMRPDLYRARLGGTITRVHEDWLGNDVKVRHVDQRFRRPQPSDDVAAIPQRRQFALPRGTSTKPKSLPFLRMYKHTSRPV